MIKAVRPGVLKRPPCMSFVANSLLASLHMQEMAKHVTKDVLEMDAARRFGISLSFVALRGLSLIGRTPRGSCNRTLLRRVLRRFFTSRRFLEGFLEEGFSVKTRFLEGFLEGRGVIEGA